MTTPTIIIDMAARLARQQRALTRLFAANHSEERAEEMAREAMIAKIKELRP